MHDREDLRIGTQEEYHKLFNRYVADDPMFLAVYSGYTRMEGDECGPGYRSETVWGLRDKNVAIMGIEWAGHNCEARKVENYWVNEDILASL